MLEAWKALEAAHGDSASLAKVEGMMPRVVKKMRKVEGDASMMEECTSIPPRPWILFALRRRQSRFDDVFSGLKRGYFGVTDYDMIFADDEQANKTASLKFLQLAAEWKRKVRKATDHHQVFALQVARVYAERISWTDLFSVAPFVPYSKLCWSKRRLLSPNRPPSRPNTRRKSEQRRRTTARPRRRTARPPPRMNRHKTTLPKQTRSSPVRCTLFVQPSPARVLSHLSHRKHDPREYFRAEIRN